MSAEQIIENTKPVDVEVGDEIVGYGTVTGIHKGALKGRRDQVIDGPFFATDTGYNMLQFPADYDVPVISKRLWVRHGE